ncbi:EF-hand domain-containing protein [Lentisalinibacter orientalis]|uniref:EF-hand domain-containing protein n=1 Tax=Lentisalinibacter orientalis TaxID=2992241 RepID=UPI0038673592
MDKPQSLREEEARELRESFDYNDRDGDGRIEFDEFVKMLEELEAGASEEEARIGFREIDTRQDGSIAFDEFVDWWLQR